MTFELDDDQLTAVGLMETGRMVRAKQIEVRSFATEIVMRSINTATQIVKEQNARAAKQIRDELGAHSEDSDE